MIVYSSDFKKTFKVCDKPQLGDGVLAKFYYEDRVVNSWYRVQIQEINIDTIKVFYFY